MTTTGPGIHTATLRGCDLALLHLSPLAGVEGRSLLQLDRHPQTWTRTLSGAELAGLARLNPDDGPPRDGTMLGLLADLTLALETLGAAWQALLIRDPRTGAYVPSALIAPPSEAELAVLGRLAAALLAEVGR